jgi:5,10-methylenetetrahydromethanopterin reductase
LEISAVFAPIVDTPDHIVLAEELGYERAWVYDVPVAWADTGITLGLAATRTSRIRLGISVMTPHLRHITMNAGLVAHLATLAPGRFDAGVGSGFTSSAFVGHRPCKWAVVEQYIKDMKTLLGGGEVEAEGHLVSLMHGPRTGIEFPIDVPFWVAAQGPMGLGVAKRLGAGVIFNPLGQENFVPPVSPSVLLAYGTVLDDGETLESPRVVEAAGPGAALGLHAGPYGPMAGTPELDGYLAAIGTVEEKRRERELHRGHLTDPNSYDRPFLTPETIRRGTFTGTDVEIATVLRRFEEAGATSVMYQPAGPDVARELRAFRRAADLRHELTLDATPQPI